MHSCNSFLLETATWSIACAYADTAPFTSEQAHDESTPQRSAALASLASELFILPTCPDSATQPMVICFQEP